jgi:hypothetical protein
MLTNFFPSPQKRDKKDGGNALVIGNTPPSQQQHELKRAGRHKALSQEPMRQRFSSGPGHQQGGHGGYFPQRPPPVQANHYPPSSIFSSTFNMKNNPNSRQNQSPPTYRLSHMIKIISILFLFLIVVNNGIVLRRTSTEFDLSTDPELEVLDVHKEGTPIHSTRSTADNLVIFNNLGKIHNLPLVEHARRTIFKPDKWDCIAFLIADEEHIPDDDPILRGLQDELDCTIPRTPGSMLWGDYLQFITPTLVSNYDYFALVLDDIFIPDRGPNPVDADKMLENMETYDIQVMSPGIVGDTWKYAEIAKEMGLDGCIVEPSFIETYVELFTRDAWKCYYKMLHYTGSKGWWYDVSFKYKCPDFRLGQDYSMTAWHMDRGRTQLPEFAEINGTDLAKWEPEPPINSKAFRKVKAKKICEKLDGCPGKNQKPELKRIVCPKVHGTRTALKN